VKDLDDPLGVDARVVVEGTLDNALNFSIGAIRLRCDVVEFIEIRQILFERCDFPEHQLPINHARTVARSAGAR